MMQTYGCVKLFNHKPGNYKRRFQVWAACDKVPGVDMNAAPVQEAQKDILSVFSL